MRFSLVLLGAALTLAPSAGLAQQKPALTAPPGHPVAAPAATQAVPTSADAFDPKVARRITTDEVKKRMDAGQKFIVIDTRSKFSGPMVKGATHVSYDKLDAWAKDLPKDTFIVAYCT